MAEPMCISEPELSLSLRSVVTGSKTATVTSLAAVIIGSAVRIAQAAGPPEFHATRTRFSRSAWTLLSPFRIRAEGVRNDAACTALLKRASLSQNLSVRTTMSDTKACLAIALQMARWSAVRTETSLLTSYLQAKRQGLGHYRVILLPLL